MANSNSNYIFQELDEQMEVDSHCSRSNFEKLVEQGKNTVLKVLEGEVYNCLVSSLVPSLALEERDQEESFIWASFLRIT